MITINILISKLEEQYPNDIFKIEKLSEQKRNEYIVKLHMIAEIKVLGGIKDETK